MSAFRLFISQLVLDEALRGNAEIAEDVAAVRLKEGYTCPTLCAPEELMGIRA